MRQITFDENLAVREVLDDIVGMVERREKLISSVRNEAEERNDARMREHVKKLEELMSDFLSLFGPVLSKVRSYADTLKETVSDSEAYLKSLVGIIDAGKAVDGASATLQELEKDASEVEEDLRESTDTLDKIEDLFKKAKQYDRKESLSRQEESTASEPSPKVSHSSSRGVVAYPSRSHVVGRS